MGIPKKHSTCPKIGRNLDLNNKGRFTPNSNHAQQQPRPLRVSLRAQLQRLQLQRPRPVGSSSLVPGFGLQIGKPFLTALTSSSLAASSEQRLRSQSEVGRSKPQSELPFSAATLRSPWLSENPPDLPERNLSIPFVGDEGMSETTPRCV